jgi:hypothetical protein
VREREVEEHHVASGRPRSGKLVDHGDHRVVVAVADHAAFGGPVVPDV